ncbi:MAG: hypothetical protein HY901_12345 [Deltaproteobacteria bacterium]|nr:hypothetical protein [Deltaproteobacteria bacterium]
MRTYRLCAVLAARALSKSPWTLLIPPVYAALLVPTAALAAQLGLVGGFVYALVTDALLASLLFVVSELVGGSRVRLHELPRSVGHYFWPIMNVLFVLWIASFLLRPVVASIPNGETFMLGIWLVLFILLNAVPEVIYRRGTYGGLAAIGASIGFVQEHWLVWLPPNLALGALLWFALPPLAAAGPLGFLLAPILAGALIHAFLVFRGFLFEELDGSTSRQRALRHRLGR